MTTNKNTPAIIKEVSPMVELARLFKISEAHHLVEATAILSELNKRLDKVTAEKERVTKPLNEALKAERSRWKPIETMLEDAIGAIRLKMTAYATEAKRVQREQENAIAVRIGEGKGKIKLETAVRKLSELEQAPKQVETEAGSITFVPTQKLKITDISIIPDAFWILDESAVFKALKAGKEVAGAEIIIEQVPRNIR